MRYLSLKTLIHCLLLVSILLTTTAVAQTRHQYWQTDNGLSVYFIPAPNLPMLDIRMTFHAGSARDGALPGLARLTNEQLASGTKTLDSTAIAQRFETVGARYSASSMRDMALVSVRTLTEPDWLETALETYIMVLSQPVFPERDFARARREALVTLQHEAQNPSDIASRVFYEHLYGEHPYGSHPTGTQGSLERIQAEDLNAFHKRYYVAHNGVLVMVGGIDVETAKNIATRIAEAIPEGTKAQALPPVKALEEARTIRIAFPSEQVHVRMGQPLIARGDEDHFALQVGNHILGGGSFTSRLFATIRNEHGLAYSVYSHFIPMSAQGPFIMGMQTQANQAEQAVSLMQETLHTLVQDGPTDAELDLAKANITGSFPLSISSNSDLLAQYSMIGFYTLPQDYLQHFIPAIEAVDANQVHTRLQHHLHPQSLLTVMVGGQD